VEKSTTELTNEYIHNHPYIKHCLKQGLLNYSSLSRHIAKELKIEKKTSMEAILIAARRLEEKLKKEKSQEYKINKLLQDSEIQIKNKICTIILSKKINFNILLKIESEIKNNNNIYYLIEGNESYLLIIQEKYCEIIEKEIKEIINIEKNLSLININSREDIEKIPGVIAYLTSLFAENEINIIEFLSCWKDTLFIVKNEDTQKIMTFLKF